MKQSGLNEILNTAGSVKIPSFSVIGWVLFLISFLLFVVVSGVLLYHWRTYGMSNKQVVFARTLYLVVSACIVCVAFVSLILIP